MLSSNTADGLRTHKQQRMLTPARQFQAAVRSLLATIRTGDPDDNWAKACRVAHIVRTWRLIETEAGPAVCSVRPGASAGGRSAPTSGG
jgi:hypothetical protein